MSSDPHSTWECAWSADAGGTVAALASAVDGDGTIVFAATPAGIRRSVDAGRTWTIAGTTKGVPFAEAVAASPSFGRDRTVLAGAADGLYVSTDGGQTWRRRVFGHVISLDLAPDVWLIGTESDGVLRSEDAGQTWAGANAGLLDLTVSALALSPSFDRDRLGFAGTTSGLYRTRNAARAWRAVETDVEAPAVQCLAISPDFADDHLILAGTEANGMFRSDDAGSTWHTVQDLADRSITALAFASSRTVAAATDAGIAVSQDGGHSWRLRTNVLGPVLSLLFEGTTTDAVLLAGLMGGGLAHSQNLGETWRQDACGLNAHLRVALALSPRFVQDQTLFVAGAQEGVSRSTDGGGTWHPLNTGLEDSTVFGVAVNGQASVYAATTSGLLRTGVSETTWEVCIDESVRAVAADRHLPVVIAATENRLLVSEDNGATWRTVADAVSKLISVALAPDGTIFFGTARQTSEGRFDVVLWRCPRNGTECQRWLTERASSGLSPVAVSPAYASDETVFVGVDGRVLKPIRNTREVRGGERHPLWRGAQVGEGSAPVTALAVSSVGSGVVFAASNAGVFVSRDGAETFRAWSEGLPQLPVVALATGDDQLLYALCLGGSLWRREVSPNL